MEKETGKIFSSKKEVFDFITSIVLIGIAVYFIIKFITVFVNAVKVVFDKYSTISVAVITGLLAFLSAIVGKFLENRYTIKNQIRKERQDVYINFLDWLINNMLYGEINDNYNIVNDLRKQQKFMTIYASDRVLKAWSVFKFVSMNGVLKKESMKKEEKIKYFIQNEAPYIENLILAIRKELGYKNKDIKKFDILKLYINDINKYL